VRRGVGEIGAKRRFLDSGKGRKGEKRREKERKGEKRREKERRK